MSYIFPKLQDEKLFEDLCKDILEKEYKQNFSIYGRRGQKQKGIDILNNNSEIIVQCKNYKSNINFLDNILSDLAVAEKNFNFKKFIIMTSLSRDTKIQDKIVEINNEKKYKVEIFFWDDIEIKISKYKLFNEYYPNFKSYIPIEIYNEIREICKFIVKSIKKIQINFENKKFSQNNYSESREIYNEYSLDLIKSIFNLADIKKNYSLQLKQKGIYEFIEEIINLFPDIYDLSDPEDVHFCVNLIVTNNNLLDFYIEDKKTIEYCEKIEKMILEGYIIEQV